MESELIEMAPEGYLALPRRDQPRLPSRLGRISETRWIRADTLRRDAEYNCTIRPFRVDAIRRAFNADGLGLIYVSEREDDQCHIIDGQHRHHAVMGLLAGSGCRGRSSGQAGRHRQPAPSWSRTAICRTCWTLPQAPGWGSRCGPVGSALAPQSGDAACFRTACDCGRSSTPRDRRHGGWSRRRW